MFADKEDSIRNQNPTVITDVQCVKRERSQAAPYMSKNVSLPLPPEPAKLNRVGLVYVGIDVNVVISLNCETVCFAPRCDSERLGSFPRPEVAARTFRGGGCGSHVQDGRLDVEMGSAAS